MSLENPGSSVDIDHVLLRELVTRVRSTDPTTREPAEAILSAMLCEEVPPQTVPEETSSSIRHYVGGLFGVTIEEPETGEQPGTQIGAPIHQEQQIVPADQIGQYTTQSDTPDSEAGMALLRERSRSLAELQEEDARPQATACEQISPLDLQFEKCTSKQLALIISGIQNMESAMRLAAIRVLGKRGQN